MQTINILEELFLSTSMWGYIGPLAIVVAGCYFTRKEKGLGLLFFIVDSLCAAQYFALLAATPNYWWQIIILLLGAVLCLVPALMDRR